MKVHTHHSVVLANKVLAAIRKLAERSPCTDDIFVRTYSNCREQGWHLTYKKQGVSICEHRNTDEIRIWYGPELSFDASGTPHETQLQVNYRCFKPTLSGINESAAFAFYFLLFDTPDTTSNKGDKGYAEANF